MFSIGEFARLGDISIRMLRHYDELELLKPTKVDKVTGYRSYSIGQLRELNRIVALRELGFSLSEVKQLLAGITVGELRAMLVSRQVELEQQLEAGRESLARVEVRLGAIEREGQLADDIVVKRVADQWFIALERKIPGFGPDNILPISAPAGRELFHLLRDNGIERKREWLSCYEVRSEDDITMYVATPLPEGVNEAPPPAEIMLLPGVEVATCVRQGSARAVYPAIVHDTMRIEAHGYEHIGPGHDYVLDRHGSAESELNVWELQVPIRRPGDSIPLVVPQRITDRRAILAR